MKKINQKLTVCNQLDLQNTRISTDHCPIISLNTDAEVTSNCRCVHESFTDKVNWLSLRNRRLKFKTFRRITNHFRGIYGIYLELMKKINQKLTICNQLDLQNTRISTDHCPVISVNTDAEVTSTCRCVQTFTDKVNRLSFEKQTVEVQDFQENY